ncbi:MAG TPA: nucleotide exchange factor GrpE [Streptosporangiaceae bacterium]
MSASEEESKGPVIRDRRRIDPVTGQPRENAQPGASAAGQAARGASQPRPGKHAVSKPGAAKAAAAESAAAESAGPGEAQAGTGQAGTGQEAKPDQIQPDGKAAAADAELAVKLAERTADLQRLQAEYANYRKRVERDRAAVREQALASVVSDMLPVLDDIGRAREHGELTGGFKAVAESLESAVGKLGLTTFGEVGEEFDPTVHEALMHSYSPDVTETTCVQILQPGYKVGERILRPARVAVAEPSDPVGARPAADAEPAEASDAAARSGADDPAGTFDGSAANGSAADGSAGDGSAETEGHGGGDAD